MGRKKRESNNANIIKLKIFFLLTLIAAGFLMTRIIKKPGQTLAQNTALSTAQFKIPTIDDIKGIMDSINLDTAKKKAEEIKNQILGQSDEIIQQKASEAGVLATDFVFDKAVKPILEQINKLPPDQLQRLRGEVCK